MIFNSFIAAVIMFLNSIIDFYQAQGLLFWLMGSLSTRAYLTVAFIWAYIIFGFLWLWAKGLSLNLITLGEEAAMQLGVETGALQRQIFIASSLMIGAMVSVSGMIGFVGLMIPHVMRLIVGSDHRLLLPASFLAGGIFLCWADTFARVLLEGCDDYRLSELEDRELYEAIENLYVLDASQRRLFTLANLLPRALAGRLSKWVEGGRYADLFDHLDDTLSIQREPILGESGRGTR